MARKCLTKILRQGVLVALLCLGMATSAGAVSYTLKTGPIFKTINGQSVYFWGYNGYSPGSYIVVPPGDNTLTITLQNTLKVPTSLVIPGLTKPLVSGTKYDAQGRKRVTSFDQVVPGMTGATIPSATYTWNNVRPGTYLYHSGFDPEVQVQMGLYGAVTKNEAAGVPYLGYQYENQAYIIFGEVDLALHAKIKKFDDGTGSYPYVHASKRDYPMINGSVTGIPKLDHSLVSGERLLVRFLNATNKSAMPTLLRGHMSVIAEDAFRYNYPRIQYGDEIPSGRTRDAIIYTNPKSGLIQPLADTGSSPVVLGNAPVDVSLFDRSLPGSADAGDNPLLVSLTNSVESGGGGVASGEKEGGLCFIETLLGSFR